MSKNLEISCFGTASLGSVIDTLALAKPTAMVIFDFCGVAPTRVASYRGYYDHLALGWITTGGNWWPSVADISRDLEGAVGSTFEGYKGGDHIMKRDTPLWVDNWGDFSGTGIIGIEFLGENTVLLQTAKVD